jgi:type I restriction enzyme R subunit
MNDIGKPERETQRRVIALLGNELGYRVLGDWTDHDGNLRPSSCGGQRE